ncbi:hypothetical protein F511_18980 [Dorcoceras hygrometricum]|uniref:Uncharacterized protein n=1 Tax=Dorcoceras hygrometricum TaxID=472368 RepID=A0A2Z7CTS7_9LAMI|nr:hypothetical protein F511_18980 [Dorcoceras hygrometricum]
MSACDLRVGRASLALSSARRCADDGRRWALPSRTVAGRLALLHAQESAAGLRTIAPRVVAWRCPSAHDACAVVALGWPLSSAIVALLCAAGRSMISHGRALLDAQLHAQIVGASRGCAALVAAVRGLAPSAIFMEAAAGGGRRPAMAAVRCWPIDDLAWSCAAGRATTCANCWRITRLRRACAAVRGLAPSAIFMEAAAGGGRRPAMLRRCRDG